MHSHQGNTNVHLGLNFVSYINLNNPLWGAVGALRLASFQSHFSSSWTEGRHLGCRPLASEPCCWGPWLGDAFHSCGSNSALGGCCSLPTPTSPLVPQPSEAWLLLGSHLCKCLLQDPLTFVWQPVLGSGPVWPSANPGSWLLLPESFRVQTLVARWRLTERQLVTVSWKSAVSSVFPSGSWDTRSEMKPGGGIVIPSLQFWLPLSPASNPLRLRNSRFFPGQPWERVKPLIC